MRRVMLSHPLPVFGLVSHYLTNNLIGRSPLLRRPKSFIRRSYRVLRQVSLTYPLPKGTLGTHYSPFRHCPQSEDWFSFDLHALAMPPAFNLSQDQTLQLMSFERRPGGRRVMT